MRLSLSLLGVCRVANLSCLQASFQEAEPHPGQGLVVAVLSYSLLSVLSATVVWGLLGIFHFTIVRKHHKKCVCVCVCGQGVYDMLAGCQTNFTQAEVSTSGYCRV